MAALAPPHSRCLLGRPALEEIEAIRCAIAHYGGSMSEVARRLRIGRPTPYRKLDSLGRERARAVSDRKTLRGNPATPPKKAAA